MIERYLDDRISDQGRRLKLMCRAGCLPVLETIGTGMKWPVPLRSCVLCETGQTDSIPHLLVTCPAFERYRKVLKTKAARSIEGLGPDMVTWFLALPESGLCDVLLGKSVGNAKIDDFIDYLGEKVSYQSMGQKETATKSYTRRDWMAMAEKSLNNL